MLPDVGIHLLSCFFGIVRVIGTYDNYPSVDAWLTDLTKNF